MCDKDLDGNFSLEEECSLYLWKKLDKTILGTHFDKMWDRVLIVCFVTKTNYLLFISRIKKEIFIRFFVILLRL